MKLPRSEVMVIGHEGGGTAPGNTMASIHEGLEAGVDMVEIDVHLTADGHLITCHCSSDYSTEGRVPSILDQTLSELEKQYPKTYLPEKYHDEEVCQLRELLDDVLPDVPLILDIKNCLLYPDRSKELLEAILELFDSDVRNEDVCVASFDHQLLQNVKRRRPDIPIGLISGSNSLHQREDLDRLEPELWLLHWRYSGSSAVELCRDRKVKVFPWVINDKRLTRKAMSVGVSGIITDHPKRIRNAINSV